MARGEGLGTAFTNLLLRDLKTDETMTASLSPAELEIVKAVAASLGPAPPDDPAAAKNVRELLDKYERRYAQETNSAVSITAACRALRETALGAELKSNYFTLQHAQLSDAQLAWLTKLLNRLALLVRGSPGEARRTQHGSAEGGSWGQGRDRVWSRCRSQAGG